MAFVTATESSISWQGGNKEKLQIKNALKWRQEVDARNSRPA